ncbi:MAG TPA: LTA synthase family protein, partial [Acholeplasma sp.]|nr:LTA synthase family protein [Acholeplasma sp.]
FGKIKYTKADLSIYDIYNKNQAEYTNVFGESYGNVLDISDASSVNIDPSLLNDSQLNGVFKDKNIMVIHLETFNHFLLDEDGPYFDSSYFKTLKALLKESYVLDNFYTNVGLGNSSDAEFSVMTGLYPRGDTTVYWNYEKTPYEFKALPKLFEGYYKASLHSDVSVFYNRQNVHEKMYEFDDYFYFDELEAYKDGTKNGFYRFADLIYRTDPKSPWVSDLALLDWTKQVATSKMNGNQPYFLFPITMQPHTPYLYDPNIENPKFSEDVLDVEETTFKYVNYEVYYDSIFKKFIEITKQLKDTVYIFYGDHGSLLPKKDVETLMGREMTQLEHKNEMAKTLAFIYAPDDTDTSSIKKGLMTGTQSLVRSQVDLYRTIVELYGLKTNEYYYGVNALSNEHTYSIDTRTFDIMTDDYYLLSKHMASDADTTIDNVYFFNPNETSRLEPYDLFKYVLVYKRRMDEAITFNLQQYLKNIS